MFVELIIELTDAVGSLVHGDRRRIVFTCVPSVIPYEVVQYLESLGVGVKPGVCKRMADEGAEGTIFVSEAQYAYCASLIAGMAPGSVAVLEPHNVRPIKPRTSWGKPNRSARGPMASILRGVAGVLGVEAKTPPVRRKNNVR